MHAGPPLQPLTSGPTPKAQVRQQPGTLHCSSLHSQGAVIAFRHTRFAVSDTIASAVMHMLQQQATLEMFVSKLLAYIVLLLDHTVLY